MRPRHGAFERRTWIARDGKHLKHVQRLKKGIMKLKIAMLSVSFVQFLSLSAAAQSDFHVFPQIADGRFSDGSFYTSTLTVTPWSDDVICAITLRGLTVDFGDGPGSSFTTTSIPGSGFLSARTAGTAPLGTGYMTVTCDTIAFAEVTYSSFSPQGFKIAEATVFSSSPADLRTVAVDLRDGARMAVAIANDTDLRRTYDLSLRDSAGNTVSTGFVEVDARSSLPRFVDELMFVPPGHTALILEIYSSNFTEFSATGLRFTGGVFSSVPAN